MSTRSVIARPTGDGFEGRYHHWDGYPSGLGVELWGLFHGRYAGDLDAMQAELIDQHPAGWSTIVGADWTLPTGFVNTLDYECQVCGERANAGHFRQYLPEGDPRREPVDGSYLYADHSPVRPAREERPPQCFCHGERSEGEHLITSTGDDCGTEWAYVLAPGGLTVCERRWKDDGGHMVGMFGMGGGADDATWLPLGIFRWDGDEPSWAALEGRDEQAVA